MELTERTETLEGDIRHETSRQLSDPLNQSYSFRAQSKAIVHPIFETSLSDDNIVTSKRKKKKKKRYHKMKEVEDNEGYESHDYENIDNTSAHDYENIPNGHHPSNGHVAITSGRTSRDKLLRIDEEIRQSEPETERSKSDIRRQALELAMQRRDDSSREKAWHYDYVLVHKTGDNSSTHERLRGLFEKALVDEKFKIEKKYTTEKTFTVLHCPFDRLCMEAEHVCLEMNLAGYVVPEVAGPSLMSRLTEKLKTDSEVDFVSAPFCVSKKTIYEGIENPDTFFRPAVRSLLVDYILNDIDIRDKENRVLGQNRQGLPYLLLEGAYNDAFILHEKSCMDPKYPLPDAGDDGTYLKGQDISDPRKFLQQTWLKWFSFQPLWKVRNYYGEKIALYFAWLGSLTYSLVVPVLLGLAIFLWGLIVAVGEDPIGQGNATASVIVGKWAKKAFDNDATPYFALIICLWGTIFLELWKRTNARLAYQWDVDQFEEQEPNRPQFYGTRVKADPVTGLDMAFYPFIRRLFKMSGSFSILLFMVCLVLASLFAVIVYRIIAREDLFVKEGVLGPTIASVTSTFLNTCSIMIMGKIYQILAYKLTDWENHRTQTSYDDALIIKLFGFQFVNSYTSLFYIAFFRQRTANDGILGFGSQYNDTCGDNNDCMTLLSLQVAMLMIMKPMPKLFTDVIVPWLKRLWRRGCCCRGSKVEEAGEINHEIEDFLSYELQKEPLGDFTLSEYTEKVLQYGFLMLFAAAFPLAPLIALLTNLIDMKMDARRLLWVNRRPIANRAEDIGMWYGILEFLNIVGVVTNGFLVTFTSDYGQTWEGVSTLSTTNTTIVLPGTNTTVVQRTIIQEASFSRLWLLIGFEHIVFSIKFLIAWLIPDIPGDVKLAQRREQHHVTDILSKAGMTKKGPGKQLTESTAAHRRLTPRETGTNDAPLERVVVQTSPRGRPGAGTRLEPLPVSYTAKVSSEMAHKVV